MKLEDILLEKSGGIRTIGFTGTRMGMTPLQQSTCTHVATTWRRLAKEAEVAEDSLYFHFGDAVGADREALEIFRMIRGLRVVNHPAEGNVRPTPTWKVLEGKPPLDRNKDIVNQSTLLVAAPLTDEQFTRSGTWATVRYAVSCGKPVLLLKIEGGYNYLPGAPPVNSLF